MKSAINSNGSTDLIMFVREENKIVSELRISFEYDGRYYFDFDDKSINNSIFVEILDGKCLLRSKNSFYFLGQNNEIFDSMYIVDTCSVFIRSSIDNKMSMNLIVQKKESLVFHNYYIDKDTITIGWDSNNDICYRNAYISSTHAVIQEREYTWEIIDYSKNGFLVNGVCHKKTELRLGDIIDVFGLKIIMGVNFLSISDSISGLTINKNNLMLIESLDDFELDPPIFNIKTQDYYNRPPRYRIGLNPNVIEIENPPMSLKSNQIPLLLRMGGSMVMSGQAALMGRYTMGISSVLFPLLSSRYSEKQKKEYEEKRIVQYRKYLSHKKEEIRKTIDTETSVLNNNYPMLSTILSYVDTKHLWERKTTDDDFLDLRIGYGDIPMLSKIDYTEKKFDLDEDPLENEMYELAEDRYYLKNVPIKNSFIDSKICGVKGSRSLVNEFIEQLIFQMSILHSYDELKLVFLLEEVDLNRMEYIRFLPHVWNDLKNIRFIATSDIESFQISEFLKKETQESINSNKNISNILKERPYYVIFALSKKLFDNMFYLKEIMKQDNNIGISIVIAFEELPKECSRIIDLSSEACVMQSITQIEEEDQAFFMDKISRTKALISMKKVANTYLKVASDLASLPETLSFMDLYKVGKVEHLNPLQRWKDNNPIKSLAVPIGVASDSTVFELDIHEKAQGPHGLIAGTTGSGKSQFIITYILSMALNFSPDEVTFLLIDYKGGGLTSSFEDKNRKIKLPHLVGTVTNLDGAAISRSLISINSELKRREKLFNYAKTVVGESNIDIYSYQKFYREGKLDKPLPHLIIVADEFAELKQQQPEFMDELISIARVGRSLGVHLILATQKPNGVVNDQIRGNARFKVCLKVQDKSDSMDMLKRADAAEIKETGRFYLQVGYDEYFALGQSAWSGAEYVPSDEYVIREDSSIAFIDSLGSVIYAEKGEEIRDAKGKTQLTAIIQYLSDIAAKNHLEPRKIWMDPIPEKIDLAELGLVDTTSKKISINLGLIDDPIQQKQYPYLYDFLNSRNMWIVGETRSGKTTMIQNMIYSLITQYTASDVNLYILDYSSRLLKIFDKLPHVGAVLTEEDNDKIPELFQILENILSERKELYLKYEVDTFETLRNYVNLPVIIVIIDGIAAFESSSQGQKIYYNLHLYLKRMSNYGIKFVITSAHSSELNVRLKQELGDQIPLTLKDRYEYSDVLGVRINATIPKFPGRGMVKLLNGDEEATYEYQTAIFEKNIEDTERVEYLKQKINEIAANCDTHKKAKRLNVFDVNQTYENFSRGFTSARLPLGYDLVNKKPVAIPFQQFDALSVYFGNPSGVVPVFKNILYRAIEEKMELHIFMRKGKSAFENSEIVKMIQESRTKVNFIECSSEKILESLKSILSILGSSTSTIVSYCKQNNIDLKSKPQNFKSLTFKYMWEKTRPQMIMIESFSDLCEFADEGIMQALLGIFTYASMYNTYIIGGFYPNDKYNKENHYIIQRFNNKGEFLMLFGGNYHQQKICILDEEVSKISSNLPAYRCIIKYRDKWHSLHMPCGKFEKAIIDEDDKSIFDEE